jgi:Heparinase II/III N-terminus/Heparinase II/III-like protein
MTDSEFFALLNTNRADLAEVQAAAAREDWTTAKHAFAEHIRARAVPRLQFSKGGREAEAEAALAHRFNSIGIPWHFGDKIDWRFNPTTEPGSKWPANHEWTWQFNRHAAWTALARTYSATGDEKYAREFVAELKSWVRECPVPVEAAANTPFSRWRTIEAGIRAGIVWPEVFGRFLPSRSFDDEALVLMVQSFVEHAQYLMRFHTAGNWLTMEANGLYHVGALFPEFRDAQGWRDTAAQRLDRELDVQVYPDGAQVELAPGYHGVAIRNFLGPVQIAPQCGFELPKDYLPKMERMFDYFLYSMQPDGRMAPLNDSADGDCLPYLKEAAQLFPNRQEFRWAATGKGTPPVNTSHFFPYAGQFFMRSGWDRNALWLCMDGGPFGFGHQHEDKLSVILTAYGKPLLVEGGTYTYDASEWRKYVLSSRAHNVVLVDGLEQNRRRKGTRPQVVKTPLPAIWETNAVFEHAAARFDEGWGPEGLHNITHTRHVFFLNRQFFVIADELEAVDGKAHTYEALFHLDTAEAKIENLQVTTQNPGPNLAIRAFGPESVRIVKGQKEPVAQGWLPDHSAGYGGIKPIPTAVYTSTGPGKRTLLYVLWPSQTGGVCPVAETRISGDQLEVRMSDGKATKVRFQTLR